MDFSTIRRHDQTTSTVTKNGKAKDKVEQSEPRFSCDQHGISWPEWSLAEEHVALFHSGQSNNAPPAGFSDEAQTAEETRVELD